MARNHQERVLDVMTDNIGMHMTIARVNEEIHDLQRRQVGQALLGLSRRGLIRKAGHGVYVYDAKQHPQYDDGHVFETIGRLQDGTSVVRSDDGQLFVLESLENHFG